MNWFLSLLTTDSTGTLRRLETSVNPEEARQLAGFFVLLAFNETSKSKNAI